MWFVFHDTFSGGVKKEDWDEICIEADNKEQAKVIFYNRFGHSPDRVSCVCCGKDYDIVEMDDLDEHINQTSEYWHMTREEFLSTILIISSKDIKEEEKHGEVPQQGWVWVE